jgi:hypothetical protein
LLGGESATIPILVAVAIPRFGNPLSTAELQAGYIVHFKRFHAIANRHPNLASVATKVLTIDYSAAAKRERVGRAKADKCDNTCRNTK